MGWQKGRSCQPSTTVGMNVQSPMNVDHPWCNELWCQTDERHRQRYEVNNNRRRVQGTARFLAAPVRACGSSRAPVSRVTACQFHLSRLRHRAV